MSKWNETGILRKKQVKDNYDDLLVFGYACKLFRDDERALYIDQGKHLIPWMGDEKLKIDRYDGRGALSDLSRCEASKEGFDAMRWLGLNDSERKIEQLCDEERYYSLHTNEEEEALYKEEELKRKQTNEFSYSYDVPQDPEKENSQDSIPTCEEEVKVYVPPPELDVPADIDIPRTVKENARIEKTALFVSQQGPQMEILIKAKQADNPQFNFMNQHDSLYKYYRHVLAAIKGGRYKTQSQQEKIEEKKDDVVEEEYLHPSLAPGQAAPASASAPMRLPQIPYKPNADCAYTQLVTRIQGAVQSNDQSPSEEPPPTTPATNQDQQQQYYQYYYSIQYYEYYKQIAQQYATQAGCDAQTILQNPQLQERIQTQASHYAQVACNQYIQNASNPYQQVPTAPPATVPVKEESKPVEVEAAAPPPATNPLQALVHYSSDSDEESEEEDVKVTFTVPPQDTAAIIDKMANYVSKNGIEFESIVKVKKDPRFDFLEEKHVYHKYYRHKVEEYKRESGSVPEPKVKEKKVIAPVSFSIKKPKEESPKEIKSALPVESDEETPCEEAATPPGPPPAPPTTTTTTVEPPQPREAEAAANPSTSEDKPQEPPESAAQEVKTNGSLAEGEDPVLEMIDLTDDLEERRDAKRAEDKIKDKLAMVAKERLASKSKDRALQMERRKRAAMFLKLKSVEGSSEETRTVSRVEEDVEEKREEVLRIDDSESEEGEIKRERRSSSRRKKSHKRRSSRSRRHESKSHRKRSKKRRRRSTSRSSSSTP